jgi:hypothetical protein
MQRITPINPQDAQGRAKQLLDAVCVASINFPQAATISFPQRRWLSDN